MNIKDAKTQIKNAVRAYLATDPNGLPLIPASAQRPVFLLGAPGIGKTAIMGQVASELGIGLVSYSMTHHTRQSALGLPFIVEKDYGGRAYSVSEYTMSEIIASVYDAIEATGLSRGILFLDEINCVSETLTPAMLQFLQFKTFGRHRVPDGWIVACAGNPPEYNKSVREFDIVTWDRLKRIDVEPDFAVWKEYAVGAGVHPSVLTYLELKSDDFYKVSTTVDGKRFVTARAWEDLSRMIRAYEHEGIEVDEQLVGQYVQDRAIAKSFAIYYDLHKKYRETYRVDDIVAGTADGACVNAAAAAPFDERLSLLGMVIDALEASVRTAMMEHAAISHLHEVLAKAKGELAGEGEDEGGPAAPDEVRAAWESTLSREREALRADKLGGGISLERLCVRSRTIGFFEERLEGFERHEEELSFAAAQAAFEGRVSALDELASAASSRLACAFSFVERAFGEGQELLLLVTELSVSHYAMLFIGEYGCDAYFAHSKELLFHERSADLEAKVRELGLGA